jgi:hypothetical protein
MWQIHALLAHDEVERRLREAQAHRHQVRPHRPGLRSRLHERTTHQAIRPSSRVA